VSHGGESATFVVDNDRIEHRPLWCGIDKDDVHSTRRSLCQMCDLLSAWRDDKRVRLV
jgi:hypothetical protein